MEAIRRERNYSKCTVVLIVVSGIIRLFFAGTVELNNDEVYYWSYAQHLQWNYFDHPPMVALAIRCFTLNLVVQNELYIRLGAVVCAALSTWVMFRIGCMLKDKYTGWVCACIYTASFYGSVIAGILILPDSPQVLFWLLAVCTMLSIVRTSHVNRKIDMQLIVLGIFIGLCILSKVHGVFLWFGFICYIITFNRKLLSNPYLYLAIVLTALMVLPSALWTVENNFATYTYHSSRISIKGLQPYSFLRELAGTILYNNPVVFYLTVTGIVYSARNKLPLFSGHRQLLFWLGLPLIGTILFISLFNDTLPHWSGPAYLTLIPFGALYITSVFQRETLAPLIPSPVRIGLALTLSSLTLSLLLINFWPGSLGNKTLPGYGARDVTLDMSGWRQFKKEFDRFVSHDSSNNNLPRAGYIFSDYWFPAGHLAFYVARPLKMHIIAVGSPFSIHHFASLNKMVPPLKNGSDAYYINISNFYNAPPATLVNMFQSASQPVLIPQTRSGAIIRYFYIYKLHNYKGVLPASGIIE